MQNGINYLHEGETGEQRTQEWGKNRGEEEVGEILSVRSFMNSGRNSWIFLKFGH
jgi:hypothetical protein